MNGYKAFFNDKTADIYAESLSAAKDKAVEHFKASKKNRHMVSVVLCELNGEQVTHSPASL